MRVAKGDEVDSLRLRPSPTVLTPSPVLDLVDFFYPALQHSVVVVVLSQPVVLGARKAGVLLELLEPLHKKLPLVLEVLIEALKLLVQDVAFAENEGDGLNHFADLKGLQVLPRCV